jgi:hypothetical protein
LRADDDQGSGGIIRVIILIYFRKAVAGADFSLGKNIIQVIVGEFGSVWNPVQTPETHPFVQPFLFIAGTAQAKQAKNKNTVSLDIFQTEIVR